MQLADRCYCTSRSLTWAHGSTWSFSFPNSCSDGSNLEDNKGKKGKTDMPLL